MTGATEMTAWTRGLQKVLVSREWSRTLQLGRAHALERRRREGHVPVETQTPECNLFRVYQLVARKVRHGVVEVLDALARVRLTAGVWG